MGSCKQVDNMKTTTDIKKKNVQRERQKNNSNYEDIWKKKYIELHKNADNYRTQFEEMQQEFREKSQTYKTHYTELYTKYEQQYKELETKEHQFDKLREDAQILEKENIETGEQYNNILQAYEELVEWSKEAQTNLATKEQEIEQLFFFKKLFGDKRILQAFKNNGYLCPNADTVAPEQFLSSPERDAKKRIKLVHAELVGYTQA